MKRVIVVYVLNLVLFVALDGAWLSIAGPKLYKPTLGDMLLDDLRIAPAVVFYLLQVAGIVWFAQLPAAQSGSWTTAALNGALFGLFCYATYDLTNYATVRNWTLQITVLDLIWGAFATAVSAALAFVITNLILGPSR